MSSATATTVRCVVAADGRVDVASRPRPMLAPDMVLVRPTTALLTPLEREVARGLGTAAGGARVLGTSCVGVVEDASRAGGLLAKGARVAIQPVFACGRCERCTGGLAMHCGMRTILGVDDASGALSELIAVPAGACTPLAKDLDDERAVFAPMLARALEAVRRGGVDKKTYASVLGDDLLAVLTTLVAVAARPRRSRPRAAWRARAGMSSSPESRPARRSRSTSRTSPSTSSRSTDPASARSEARSTASRGARSTRRP